MIIAGVESAEYYNMFQFLCKSVDDRLFFYGRITNAHLWQVRKQEAPLTLPQYFPRIWDDSLWVSQDRD